MRTCTYTQGSIQWGVGGSGEASPFPPKLPGNLQAPPPPPNVACCVQCLYLKISSDVIVCSKKNRPHVMEMYLKPRKISSTSSCDQYSGLEEPASKTIALLNLLLL